MADRRLTISEAERSTLIASLTLAALEYADPSGQIELLEKLGCENARDLIETARAERAGAVV